MLQTFYWKKITLTFLNLTTSNQLLLDKAAQEVKRFDEALTTTTRLTYAEVPVNILRKFTFTDLGVFYVGAGGYVAMGIGGKLDYETPGTETSDKIEFGKDLDVKRFDTGLNFSTGFEFRNKVTFNMGFSLGLNNIASTTQQDSGTSVVKNREFLIGLGYLFK